MKKIVLFFALCCSAFAQQSYHIIKVIPSGGLTGEIDWCGDSSHAATCVRDQSNAAGTIITTTGARTITGNLTAGSGDNAYLTVDAGANSRAGITKKSGTIPKFTHGKSDPFVISQSSGPDIGSANTFTDDVTIIGGNVTARNVFNSIGDVPITGAGNTSGTTITQTSGDIFNVSMVGGNILICAGGCSGTNGSLFLVSAFVDTTHLTLATSPGTLTGAGWSYQGNAFQTSQGTMYITGSGFAYAQNMVVTNGFTALATTNLTGNVTCSGTSCVLNSGDKFNLSMQGGSIVIVATTYIVATVDTDHSLTLTSSAGAVTGAYSYTPIGVIVKSGGIDITGNSQFRTGVLVSGGSVSITSAGSFSTVSGGFNAGSGGFTGNGSLSGTHLQNLGAGDIVNFGLLTSTLGLITTNGGLSISGSTGPALSTIVNAGAGAALNVTTAGTISMNFTDSGGTCRMSFGAGGVTCPSDIRLKTNILPMGPELANLMRLRPVEYVWKSNGNRADGLIAQEVLAVYPLAVHMGEDGLFNVSYQQLVPYLIRAIQDQQNEIAGIRKALRK